MCENSEPVEIDDPEPTLRNCEPPDLYDRCLMTEAALRDCNAHEIEMALAVTRERLTSDVTEANAQYLMGALCVADAALEQLSAITPPCAIDGDIYYRYTSFPPGRRLRDLIKALLEAESKALSQRSQLLVPLTQAAIQQANTDAVSN